jgi:hypothetical protein
MVTIFSSPKPFQGHINVIQRNAIKSWTLLHPDIEVIVFGDDEGAAEVCEEYNIRHEPVVRRSPSGAKYLDLIFAEAQRKASHPITCYVNADMILLSDFMKAVEQVARWRNRFLMVGRRTNLDALHLQDFDSPDWETRLRGLVLEKGVAGTERGIDYFVFNRGLFPSILPLALGGPYWDNWLIWRARSLKAPVVDASAAVLAIHQNHDYSHHPQGYEGIMVSADAVNNLGLVGERRVCTLDDATHKLAAKGFEWNAGQLISPGKRAIRRWWLLLLRRTTPLRHRLGIRGARLARFSNFVLGIKQRRS